MHWRGKFRAIKKREQSYLHLRFPKEVHKVERWPQVTASDGHQDGAGSHRRSGRSVRLGRGCWHEPGKRAEGERLEATFRRLGRSTTHTPVAYFRMTYTRKAGHVRHQPGRSLEGWGWSLRASLTVPRRVLLTAPAASPAPRHLQPPAASSASANTKGDSCLPLLLLVWCVGFSLHRLSDAQRPKR